MGKKKKGSKHRRAKTLRDAEGRFRGSVSVAPAPASSPDLGSFDPHGLTTRESVLSGSTYADVEAAYQSLRTSIMTDTVTPSEAYRVSLAREVARHLDADPDSVLEALDRWRDADSLSYEDYPAPNPNFRYDQHPDAGQDEREQRALRKLGYEHFLRQLHPVFVYGTLRSGQGNSVLMDRARERDLPAVMRSASMYTKHWGFPYAKEDDDPNESIVGEIVWLSDSPEGDDARAALDYLEGFDSDFPSSSHYERVEREIEYLNPTNGTYETTKVWVYFARGTAAQSLLPQDKLESGDWVAENRTRRR